MTKPATIALALSCLCLPARLCAAAPEGKPVPFFPQLTWGLSEEAARSKGLETYGAGNAKVDVVGMRTIMIGGIAFSARAMFGKRDRNTAPSGLNTIVLQHEGAVPTKRYYSFLRSIKDGFLYAGRGSAVDESSVFYDAVGGDSHLVVTSFDHAKISLSIAIAPGRSK